MSLQAHYLLVYETGLRRVKTSKHVGCSKRERIQLGREIVDTTSSTSGSQRESIRAVDQEGSHPLFDVFSYKAMVGD